MIALPAFRGLLFKAAGGAAPDIEFVAATSGNIGSSRTPVTTGPTAEVNDILICVISTDSQHFLGATFPTGWYFHDLQSPSGGDHSTCVFWKRVTTAGADSSTWTNLFTTTESGRWVVAAYRNCVTEGSPIGNAVAGPRGSLSTWNLSLTTTTAESMVVGIFGADQASGATFTWSSTDTTERADDNNNGLGYVTIGDRPALTTGTYVLSGTASAADSYTYNGLELLKTNPSPIKFVSYSSGGFSATASPATASPVAEVDDILILVFALDTDATLTANPLPTGWNFLDIQTYTTEHSSVIFWKRVTTAGTDSSTWTNLFTTTESGNYIIAIYKGCITSGSPFANISTGGFASTTTWSVPITSTTANSTCVGIFAADALLNTLCDWTSPDIRKRVDYNYVSNLGYITMGDLYTPTTGTYVLSGTVNLGVPYTRFGCELLPQ